MLEAYGGVFVYNREEEILEQYEVEIRSTVKGRGALGCNTDQGAMTPAVNGKLL